MNKKFDHEKENAQLKRENRALKRKADTSKALGFMKLVSRYLLVGRNVSDSTENLIRKYKRCPFEVHDKEIAEVFSAVVNRIVFLYLLGAFIALLPFAVLLYQSFLISRQTDIQERQFAELLANKDLEEVRILSCKLWKMEIWLEADAQGQTTPGRRLDLLVVNDTRSSIVFTKLKVWIVEDGEMRFAHSDTHGSPFVKGVYAADFDQGYFLNPGIGGNEVAEFQEVIGPRNTETITCYIPMPLSKQKGRLAFRGELTFGRNGSQAETLGFYKETATDNDSVIDSDEWKELIKQNPLGKKKGRGSNQ